MTTVIDPGTGGEAAVFNKSGTAILTVELTDNFTMTIPHVAGRVILNVSYPQAGPDPLGWSSPIFSLSSDFEIGDEVWILTALATRPSHDIFSTVTDSVGNIIRGGGMSSGGFFKVGNDPEIYSADGSTLPVTNWKILSIVNP